MIGRRVTTPLTRERASGWRSASRAVVAIKRRSAGRTVMPWSWRQPPGRSSAALVSPCRAAVGCCCDEEARLRCPRAGDLGDLLAGETSAGSLAGVAGEELYVSASKKLNRYGPVDDLVIVDRRTYVSRLVENNLHGDFSAEGVAFATTSFEVAGGENDLLALVGAAYLD